MIIKDLKKLIKGDIVNSKEVLDKYSEDYSVFKITPEAVVFPKSSDDIKKLVKFVVERTEKGEKVSLTARSGGTDMTGGPLSESIVLGFDKYFNHIKEITEKYAVAEPGVYFRDFEKEIGEKGLIYPPYPASKYICALGGMIANNSGGEKTLSYGKTEKYVEELKVILSDGKEYNLSPLSLVELKKKIKEKNFFSAALKKVYKLLENNYEMIQNAKPNVSKNSAGYPLWNVWNGKVFDPTQLFIGSQGTLGIITEAKLKLVREKKFRRLAVVFLKDVSLIGELVVSILRFHPEALESYDDKTFKLALRFLPGILRSMKGGFVSLAFQFIPEALMVLTGGIPKLVILAEFSSDDEADLKRRVGDFIATMRKNKFQARLTRDEKEAEKYRTIRRESFKLLHEHTKGRQTAPFIDDMIVRPEYLPQFLPQLNKILDRYKDKLIYTIAGHPGDGNFHIIPLMDFEDPETPKIIKEISEQVYDLVLKYGGSITAEHNDGLIRGPYLEKMYGKKICNIFREVKNIFDPLNIFNPGKKIDADFDYALKHLKKS